MSISKGGDFKMATIETIEVVMRPNSMKGDNTM